MPYIDPEIRTFLEDVDSPQTAGEFTYVIYKLMVELLPSEKGVRDAGRRFVHYHKVLGAVEAAKMEFYRRHVAPYEDKKIEQNGDVT